MIYQKLTKEGKVIGELDVNAVKPEAVARLILKKLAKEGNEWEVDMIGDEQPISGHPEFVIRFDHYPVMLLFYCRTFVSRINSREGVRKVGRPKKEYRKMTFAISEENAKFLEERKEKSKLMNRLLDEFRMDAGKTDKI